MKVLDTKIVNGKKLYLIDEQSIKAETGFSGNFYYVPIQGINSSDNLKTKFTTAKQLTKEQVEQLQNSPTSAKNIAIKEALEKTERLKKSEQAYKKRQETGIQSSQDLADETGAIGDKISLQKLPIIGNYIPEELDVTKIIGDMASSLGRLPLNLERGNYGQAALSVAMPLGVGALAGVGTENTGQFVNNIVNPLAGTGDLINNLGNKYLPNAYKLNPLAFKPNPEMMYRGIGKEGMEDALESGVFRAKQNVQPSLYGGFDLSKEFKSTYYTPKFNTADQYGKGFIAEVPKDVTPFRLRYKGKGNKTWSQIADENIPIEKGRILQKDWLKGYKEIPKPQQTFKSAIGNNGMFNMTNPLAGIKLKANLPEGTVINGVSLNPFKGKIDKKIELIPVPSKFRGEDAYNIKYGDKFIGDFDFEKINDRYVPFSISIDKEYRGQGLGKEAYEVANKLLKSQGKGSLHSSGFFIGDNAKHVWRSLEKTGKAEKIGEDSWKFLKFGGTIKVLDTKIEGNKKMYLIED